MAKNGKKTERDVELITLIDVEEFLSLLPWKEEVSPINVADLAKNVLKGKTKYRIASNAKCIKHLMSKIEEQYAGKLFDIRMSGSDHFWSLSNVGLLRSFRKTEEPEKKTETGFIPADEPKQDVLMATEEPEETEVLPISESITTEQTKEEQKSEKKPSKPAKPLVQEDYVKAYFLLSLIVNEPISSKEIKKFCEFKGWGKVYGIANRVLKENGLPTQVDTSSRYWVMLSDYTAKTDVVVLLDILRESYEIPADVENYISTLELPVAEEEEKEQKTTSKPESEEEITDEEAKKIRTLHLSVLKQRILSENGMFRSEIYGVIKSMNLMIPLPPDELFGDDIMVRAKRNSIGRNEDYFYPSPVFLEKIAQEEKKRIEFIPIEFLTNTELPLDDFLHYEDEIKSEKFGIHRILIKVDVRTKLEILSFIELYAAFKKNMEFSGNETEIMADLRTRVLS